MLWGYFGNRPIYKDKQSKTLITSNECLTFVESASVFDGEQWIDHPDANSFFGLPYYQYEGYRQINDNLVHYFRYI